jgi:hypothetical protein
MPNLLPGIQAALRTAEESMGEEVTETTAVKVNNASALAAGEDDATVEGVATLGVEQANTPQEMERKAASREMKAQAPAGSIADAQFFDQCGIAQSALLKVMQRLGVAIELGLIERSGFLEDSGRVDWRSALLLKIGEALAEGQMTG